MDNKGFTLIELLAVIVILSIIALIATPIVINTIEKSKKGATERSAENYIDTIDTEIATRKLETGNMVEDNTYTVNSSGDICLNNDCTDKLLIEMNGTKPSSGTISIKNGQVSTNTSLVFDPYTVSIENNKVVATLNNKSNYGILVLDHSKKSFNNTCDLGDFSVKYNYLYDQKSGQDVDAEFYVWYDTVLDNHEDINNNCLQYGGANPIQYSYEPEYEYTYKLYANNNVGTIIYEGTKPGNNRQTLISNYIKNKYNYTLVEIK